MAAFWMCELSPTEVADSDAFNRNQVTYRQVLTHDRASKVGRVWARRRALRVLIVDDDRDTTDGLVKLVRCWGHTARLAYDGLSALKTAAIQHPDVVLLDMEMPFLDGCQVARQLRLDFPTKECFLIALRGRSDDDRRRRCNEAGIDLVLVKPIHPSVIETLLMLECERVNRGRTGRPSSGTSKFSFPLVGRREVVG